MTTTTDKVKGIVTRWRMGDEGDWCTMFVDLGIIQAEISLSSREARAFALDVLGHQGPYLGYQPPNERMREVPAVTSFQSSDRGRRRSQHEVGTLASELSSLRERFGDDVFGWALQKMMEET